MTAKHLSAEHGIVCQLPGDDFGYFGWPTVERLDNGTMLVGSRLTTPQKPRNKGNFILASKTRYIMNSKEQTRRTDKITLGVAAELASKN